MEWRTFLGTFAIVFLAELGDKTQLATVLLAARSSHRTWVLLGAVLALCAAAGLGVAAGTLLERALPLRVIHTAAGISFLALGFLLLAGKA